MWHKDMLLSLFCKFISDKLWRSMHWIHLNLSSSVLIPRDHQDTSVCLEKCSPAWGPASPHPQWELTFGRQCWRPARRPPASSSGQRSCLPAAPPSSCCRFFGCSPGSQTLKRSNPRLGACPDVALAFPRLVCTCSPFKSSPDSGAGVRFVAAAVCASLREKKNQANNSCPLEVVLEKKDAIIAEELDPKCPQTIRI